MGDKVTRKCGRGCGDMVVERGATECPECGFQQLGPVMARVLPELKAQLVQAAELAEAAVEELVEECADEQAEEVATGETADAEESTEHPVGSESLPPDEDLTAEEALENDEAQAEADRAADEQAAGEAAGEAQSDEDLLNDAADAAAEQDAQPGGA